MEGQLRREVLPARRAPEPSMPEQMQARMRRMTFVVFLSMGFMGAFKFVLDLLGCGS
jgi:hypothetical protein